MSRKDSIFFFFNVIYYCLTDLFLSLRHVIAYSKIAFFCQLTMTWKRHSMPVNKQNCSYSIRHLFSSSYSSFPLFFVFFFSLLVLLSPVTCTYSYSHIQQSYHQLTIYYSENLFEHKENEIIIELLICHYRCSRPSTTITYKYTHTHARESEQPLNTTNYYYYNSSPCVYVCTCLIIRSSCF